TNRLKVGVVVAGATAGEARLRAEGAVPRLILGAAGADVVTVQNGGVGIGAAPAAGYMLNVGGVINATDVLRNGAPLSTSQWTNVAGGIAYTGGNVGIGDATPYARLTVDGSIGFTNAATPMLYIFESGTTNPERSVVSHSPAFPGYGLFYRDVDDRFIFRGGGTALTADLGYGRVGVGTENPNARLHVAGGSWDVGNSEGDFKVGDDTYRLKIGVALGGGGAGDVRVRAVGGTNRLMLGAGTSDTLFVTDGAVGVGTITPSHRFHVVAPDAVGLFESSTNNAYLRFYTSEGSGNRVEFCNRPGGRAAIWVAGYGDALNVNRDGTVHIPGRLTVGALTAGSKIGYVVDHFVNHTGDPVEQGDVVVLGERGAVEYWSTGNSIPIPEVDLAAELHDRRVCGIVDVVTTQRALPFADAREPQRPAKSGKGRRRKAAEEEAAPAEAAEHPLARYAAADDDDVDLRTVGPGQMGSMVTLGAFSHCKVDADIAPIQVGDLLTTSPTRGHAQKVLDPAAAMGAIVGKALAPLAKGRGKIPVMVLLQ
ncbi:MAG TPA: hypothetical protein VF263_13295, partial [Longimicrobiaceae bacterium]